MAYKVRANKSVQLKSMPKVSVKKRKRKKNGNVVKLHLKSLPSTSSVVPVSATNKARPRSQNQQFDFFPFADLPLNVQRKIFSYLPLKCRVRLERVSMTWKHLLNISWQNITFADIPSTVTNSFQIRPINDHHVCGFLQKCGRYLRYIDFFIPHVNIGRHVLFSICKRCVNLRELRLITDVNGCAMTNLLKEYSHQLAQLHALSISYQAQDELNNGMRAVARSMTELRAFRLDCYTMPANVSALFPNSPHMKIYSLLLKQPPNVNMKSSNVLNSVNVHYDCKYVRSEFVTEFFAYLVDVYLELEQLDISFDTNYPVNEELIYNYLRLIGMTRPLKHLNLRIAALLNDSSEWFGAHALQALSFFPTLRHLSLWTCTIPPNLTQMVAGSSLSSNITSLRLAIVKNLSHEMLKSLFRVLPLLTSFTLVYSIADRFLCPKCIDVLTFVHLFHSCPKLSNLELHDCMTVDTLRLGYAAHSHFHDSFIKFGDNGHLKIVVKSRERKRRKDSVIRSFSCCSEKLQSQNSTTFNVFKVCREPKKHLSSDC